MKGLQSQTKPMPGEGASVEFGDNAQLVSFASV